MPSDRFPVIPKPILRSGWVAGFLAFGLFLQGIFSPTAQAAEALRFAALSLEGRDTTAREFAPFVEHLERLAGRPVVQVFFADYAELLNAFRLGRIDLAYLGPLPYVRLRESRPDVEPLIHFREKDGASFYRCALAAFRGDRVRAQELRGQPFGMPQALSTCGPLAASGLLAQKAGLRLEEVDQRFLGNHEMVALAIISGEIRAGTMKESIARRHGVLGLEILGSTDPLPGFALVAQVDRELREKLRKALLETPKSIWSHWGESLHYGMSRADDRDYDPIRRLGRSQP